MNKDNPFKFDFQFWAKLYADNPAEFEARRSDIIKNMISAVPSERRQRLRGLQFRLDGIRQINKEPESALQQLSQLMWDKFIELQDSIQGKLPNKSTTATVLNFNAKIESDS